MKHTKFFLTAFLCSALCANASVKPRIQKINAKQSDGTQLVVKHIGNGKISYFTTADGYLVMKNSDGDFFYVTDAGANNYKLSASVAHNPGQRTAEETAMLKTIRNAENVSALNEIMFGEKNTRAIGSQETAPLTSMGTPSVPVILVQFADKKFTAGTDDADVNRFYNLYCNGDGSGNNYTGGGSYGSIKDYFTAQSDGLFKPEFHVIGPVTLDKGYAHYGENSSFYTDKNINEFFSEALTKAQAIQTSWEDFDNDGDGVVDMAFFIYAGEGENGCDDPNTIWPKEMASGGTINGTAYGAYACCNEVFDGATDGIGTMCHELSHALGLPDFYDTNYKMYGMDYWDLMDSGNYCENGRTPCGYSSYQKDFMGWKKLIALSPDTPQKITAEPLSKGGNGYKITNTENPNEFYTLENRQNDGWDKYIGYSTRNDGHHGLLITHIDYDANKWMANRVNTDASHQRLTLIPADGTLDSYMHVASADDLEEYLLSAGGDPYPGTNNVHELADDKAVVYTQSGKMNQPIRDIEEDENGTITFKYCITEKLDAPVISELSGTDGYIYWNAIDGADGYVLTCSKDVDFKNIILKVSCSGDVTSASTDSIIKSGALEAGETLYVKVKATAEMKLNSDESSVISFVLSPSSGIVRAKAEAEILQNEGLLTVKSPTSKNISVNGIEGLKYAESRNGEVSVYLKPGIYIVTCDGNSRKILIR